MQIAFDPAHGYVPPEYPHFDITAGEFCKTLMSVPCHSIVLLSPIERIRPLNDSIVKRLYSIKEKEYVYSVADVEDRRFSEIWTRKEAYIKRDDRNISLGSFSIDTFKDVIDGQIKTYCIGKYVISVCGNQAVAKFDLMNQEKFRSMIGGRKV